MDGLCESVDRVATESDFAGVVRVDQPGEDPLARAFGLAHRGSGRENTLDTRFSIASGTKGLTALTVMKLVDDGLLGLDTRARSLLGKDLPPGGRSRHDRASAGTPLGHRELPQRGGRQLLPSST